MTEKEINGEGITHHVVTGADTPNLLTQSKAADQVLMAQQTLADGFDAIKALGRMETADFMATVATKVTVETYISMKESKKYKALQFRDGTGNWRNFATLEEYCEVHMPLSYRRVRELAANYNSIGAELFEQAERLGFRQRDYNALKALPSDDRLIIAQAIESEDLDKALDLMQQLAAKHQREKEVTEKQIDELVKSVGAKDSVIKGKSEELDKKNEQLARIQLEKSTKIDEVAMPGEFMLRVLQDYSRELTVKITATLNSKIALLYQEFDGQPPKHIELAARQSVGLIITAAYGVADNMGFEPILDPEQAADEPGRADAKAFEDYLASQQTQTEA